MTLRPSPCTLSSSFVRELNIFQFTIGSFQYSSTLGFNGTFSQASSYHSRTLSDLTFHFLIVFFRLLRLNAYIRSYFQRIYFPFSLIFIFPHFLLFSLDLSPSTFFIVFFRLPRLNAYIEFIFHFSFTFSQLQGSFHSCLSVHIFYFLFHFLSPIIILFHFTLHFFF